MKKYLSQVLLAVLLFGSYLSQAQTYIRTATGANNVFPFGSSTNRVQYLYYPSDFTPAVPMGVITKVYFRAASTTTSTYTNMTLDIGTTTLTAMPTGSNPWITGLTNAFFSPSYTISAVSGNWFVFNLTTPFFWDGTSNIIIDIYSNSAGSITLTQGSVGGNRRMWGVNGNTTSNGGGAGSATLALDIIPGSPCTRTTPMAATTISSMAAQVNWAPVTGSFQYEYVIDTTTPGKVLKAPVITTATTAYVTGLIPGKTHYLRVRNYCSAVSYSLWDTIAFTTLPPCNKPSGFIASNVDSNSGNIQWLQEPNVTGYQYLVDTFRNAPLSTNPNIKNVSSTGNFQPLTGLEEGRWHYVHIRARCVMNDSSAWSLDSFYTPTPCRKPTLALTHLTSNNSIVSWAPVKTAKQYEYYFGSASTLPPNGTPVKITSVQTPYLLPATNYSVHVRCMCEDNGIKQSSGWSSIDFTSQFATGISNTESEAPIMLYPNPVTDVLSIKAGPKFRDTRLTILNLKGQTLGSFTLQGTEGNIDVSSYTPGVYILQYTDNEQTQNIKFTKQ